MVKPIFEGDAVEPIEAAVEAAEEEAAAPLPEEPIAPLPETAEEAVSDAAVDQAQAAIAAEEAEEEAQVEAAVVAEGWVEVVFVGQGKVRCADGTKIGKGETGPMTESDALEHADAGNVKLLA